MSISLDDVAQAVSELSTAVQDMARGMVDRQTVEGIAQEVMSRSRGAQRRGFEPSDLDGLEGLPVRLRGGLPQEVRTRGLEIHTRPPVEVAHLLGRAEQDVRELHRAGDTLALLTAVLNADRAEQETLSTETAFYRDEYRPVLMAMDSTTAGEGDEWVPTELSGDLIERVNLELLVARLFPFVEMPSNPFDIAALSIDRQRGGKHPEQTGDTGQTKIKAITPATRKVTLTAVRFGVRVIVSKDLDEDSLVPIMPFLQAELVDYIAADLEDAIINGDAQGAHMDADVVDADDPRRNWDGLRARTPAGAKTDASAAAKLTPQHLRDNRKVMGRYGVRADQLAHIVSINSYLHLLEDTAVQTLDKYGPAATILTGELAKVDGIPVIVSEFVRTDLDATGVNSSTPANNTKTIAATVNRRGFLFGQRRAMTVQVLREVYAESDQDGIVVTTRRALEPRFPSTEPIVAYVYNVGI